MRMTGLCGGLEHVDHARPCRRHELRLHWVAIHRCRALRYSRCRIGRVSCVPAVGAFNDYPASSRQSRRGRLMQEKIGVSCSV